MNVVADAGPLIGLASIERLELLTVLAEVILIPPTVRRELLGKPGTGATDIDDALDGFLELRELPPMKSTTADAVADLDQGEAEVILLAGSTAGEVLLLMDDQAGRKVAEELGLSKTGLVGLLLRAKENNRIDEVTAVLHKLRAHGYWLSDEIVEVAKHRAGE